jgi:hypothetical protein
MVGRKHFETIQQTNGVFSHELSLPVDMLRMLRFDHLSDPFGKCGIAPYFKKLNGAQRAKL